MELINSNKRDRPTADLDGSLQFKQDGLANEDFAGLLTQKANFVLRELHLLARSTPANCRTCGSAIKSAQINLTRDFIPRK